MNKCHECGTDFDKQAEMDLVRRRKLQAITSHLNFANPELWDSLDDQIAQVEEAAQWARRHIEERGKLIDELQLILGDVLLRKKKQ